MRNIIKSAFVRACAIFTVAMALWCAAGLIFAGPVEGIVIALSLLAAALALCALQAFWFTEVALKRPSYPARIAGFGLTGLPVLVLCAALGGWFPLDNIGAWICFIAIYLVTLAAITAEDVLPFILRKVRFGTLDELYATIGYGGTTAAKAVARIKDELLRLGRLQAEKAAAAAKTTAESVIVPGMSAPVEAGQLKGSNKHTDSGIIVEGLGNCLVKFAKCCTPVPGDPVVGFITRGYGVSVHRADCPNAAPDKRKPEEADRWVKVSWVNSSLPHYKTALELSAKDRDGLTLDVAMALSSAKVKVSALSARSQPDGYATVNIVVEVKDKEELNAVINKLNNIQGVYHVARASGK